MEMQTYQKIELAIKQKYGVDVTHKNQVSEYMVSKAHDVLSKCVLTRWLDKFIIAVSKNIGANAEPHKNTVVVNDHLLERLTANIESYTCLLLHEVGHVKDYQDRGKLRFWISAMASIPGKIRCSKHKSIKRLEIYYNTGLEKRANAYSNLTYRDFIF